MPRTRWIPPVWLIAADLAGFVAFVLGLALLLEPDGPIAVHLRPTLRLPLLLGGGLVVAICSLTMLRQILAAQGRG
jgi:hypothetical protein